MERLLLSNAGKNRGGDISREAQRIWSMLDEMAEENPESYKKFVETNIREGKELFEPPIPFRCFQTKLLSSKDKLFINICSYSRIKKPQPNTTVSTLAGEILSGFYYRGERVQCVAVAFHPDMIEKMKSSREDEYDLMCMVIRFLQDMRKVSISSEFERWKEDDYVGLQTMLSDISRTLHGMDPVTRVPDVPDGVPTLEQISRLAKGDAVASGRNGDTAAASLLNSGGSRTAPPASAPSSAKPLVTEVGSSPSVRYTHRIEVRPADKTKPKRAVFIAALPNVERIADITVDISKDDISVQVPSQPTLCLRWPQPVKDTKVIANFTKSRQLIVKAPLL
eukprot:scpid62631/ scgid32842/ PIH1 domain-containing protein 2